MQREASCGREIRDSQDGVLMRIAVLSPRTTLASHFIIHRKHDTCMPSCDVSDPVDALVTFPASIRNSRLSAMAYEDWDIVIENTLNSVAKSMIAFLPYISSGGAVVVVGSIVGSTGGYGCANYAAAKAGLVGLVRSAALEVADRQIRVNLLELGYVDAGLGARLDEKQRARALKQIPLGRFARVEEVMHAIDFLLEQTYMTGNVLTVAGGLR